MRYHQRPTPRVERERRQEKELADLKRRVESLEHRMIGHPDPVVTYPPALACSKCGMSFKGATGYVCVDNYCPIQPKVT